MQAVSAPMLAWANLKSDPRLKSGADCLRELAVPLSHYSAKYTIRLVLTFVNGFCPQARRPVTDRSTVAILDEFLFGC
jgi:hypothetical protein